jgi:glycosyltransferase involved in cell wall biosynthesis
MQKNRFKIIVPSYNNSNWVEYNIASILNQTYSDFRVLYISDNSTDDTYEKALSIAGSDARFTIINNEINRGAAGNYFENNHFIDDQDIVVHLDGDDWFEDEYVLEKLDKVYSNTGCWMTYGKFIAWYGEDNYVEPYPQNTEYPDIVHEYKLYRKDLWRPSHCRTYRGFLFKAIREESIRDLKTKSYYWHALDLAFQYPYMEMAGRDKIKAVDFYTTVYNQHPLILGRTRQRESKDNEKYEIEIRNRKKYKEGLTAELLPLVNVIGDFRERNSIPKKFSYCYNLQEGEFDVTLIQDMDIIKYINGEIKISSGKVIADIHEAPHLLDQRKVYEAVYNNYKKFDFIHTFDEELLTLPNAIFRNGGYEVVLNKNIHSLEYPKLADNTLIKVYDNKQKLVSFVTSNKTMTDGHRFRIDCYNELSSNNLSVDIFGVGINPIEGKIQALKDYKFSIAIENGIHNNYFTEKILDCFLTGVIPIYRGAKNIDYFFDKEGIITFNTVQELIEILSSLTEEYYYSRLNSIKNNFEKAKKYAYDNDSYFEKFIKPII